MIDTWQTHPVTLKQCNLPNHRCMHVKNARKGENQIAVWIDTIHNVFRITFGCISLSMFFFFFADDKFKEYSLPTFHIGNFATKTMGMRKSAQNTDLLWMRLLLDVLWAAVLCGGAGSLFEFVMYTSPLSSSLAGSSTLPSILYLQKQKKQISGKTLRSKVVRGKACQCKQIVLCTSDVTTSLTKNRSPLDGASISHTSPWSQPFPE